MVFSDAKTVRSAATRLRALGFGAERLQELLGTDSSAVDLDEAVAARRLSDGELEHVVRLFVLGETLSREDGVIVAGSIGVERLEETGLIATTGAGVKSRIKLTPTGDELLVASDRSDILRSPGAKEYVGGPNPVAERLSNLTVRQAAGRALDMGCGGGIQALRAAPHCDLVIGVDVSERALAFAELNALLNDVNNLELRQGSFFGPVADERFDLVVANPPFVISPDRTFILRDSGLPGHDVSRHSVGGAGDRLNEGGFAHVLANWIQRPGEPWWAEPAFWIAGRGCDAWILHTSSLDPLAYAANWNRLDRTTNPANYKAILDRWSTYLHDLGADSVVSGAVILRKRTGENWIRTGELEAGLDAPAGDHVADLFAAQGFLESHAADDALLETPLCHASDLLVRVDVRFADGGSFRAAKLSRERGLTLTESIQERTLALISRLNGTIPLSRAATDAAAELAMEPDALLMSELSHVRRLIELGFLVGGSGRR